MAFIDNERYNCAQKMFSLFGYCLTSTYLIQ
ncbi:hypothetical protein Slin_6147 [Spirosoma linguale DSM 74]|uniref:Uncharacterized protein n=1 Tax=Spirosoma linguale (strain ATCC 33905 / DSM 74 / LMG 10896 / Claus 1) TaxID=504472 RepID=D2QTH5_SPILD|nr:hypothetical protein Slin_6147 [Spirosoma linguale DSM 74]